MIFGDFAGGISFGAAAAVVASAKRLQAALQALGRTVKDSTLFAIKVDGALGAKTVAGVNRAFTKHLGVGQAPANYRTGKLTLAQVKAAPDALAALLEAEVKRRGGSLIPITATKKTATAKKAVAKKPATKKAAKPAAKKVAVKKKATKVVAKVSAPKVVKTTTGKTVSVQDVRTEDGQYSQQITDLETGEQIVTEPTTPPPPPPRVAAMAPTSASPAATMAPEMAPAMVPDTSPIPASSVAPTYTPPGETPAALIPGGMPEAGPAPSSSKLPYWIAGGVGAAVLLGVGAMMILKRRKPAAV